MPTAPGSGKLRPLGRRAVTHRSLNVFAVETKSFHAGLKITEEGEFLRWNDWKKTYEGMSSPLAQNERHIAILKDAFNQIEMPSRLGIRLSPTFHSVVVVDTKARIDRPKKLDTGRVIKADMLTDFIQKTLDQQSAMGFLAKLIGTDTLEQISRGLASLHRPAAIDYRAKFGMARPRTKPRVLGRNHSGLSAQHRCSVLSGDLRAADTRRVL
jgi:hypothetical protein